MRTFYKKYDLTKYIQNGKIQLPLNIIHISIEDGVTEEKIEIAKALTVVHNDKDLNINYTKDVLVYLSILKDSFFYYQTKKKEKKPFWRFEGVYTKYIIHENFLYYFYEKDRKIVERMIKIEKIIK